MMKKGITRRTFFFTFSLIILVLVLSFSILYVTMPSHYYRLKRDALQKSTDVLTNSLANAQSEDDCAQLISSFATENNANVICLDAEGILLPTLSTPFAGMTDVKNAVYISFQEYVEGPGRSIMISRVSPDEDGTITYDALPEKEGPVIRAAPSEENYIVGKALPEKEGAVIVNGRIQGMQWVLKTDTLNAITTRAFIGTGYVNEILVSSTLQPIGEAQGVIISLIPYLLLLSVFAGLMLAYLHARRLTQPILAISNAAVRMQHMEEGVVSGIRSDDELGELSNNLDTLYGHLHKNIRDLQAQMERANRLEQSRTELLQSTGHELKTPIAALSGMVEGMLDNIGVYKDREKYLYECKQLIDKLAGLVNEILNASKADLPDMALTISEIDLTGTLSALLAERALFIQEKGLSVEIDMADTNVFSDETLLRRALANIVENAVRYTPLQGCICICVKPTEAGLMLEIENQCEHIPEEELTRLLEPFYTRSYSRDKSQSGTGLGLYIAKKNLDRLGITLTIRNTETGIKLTLRFPTGGAGGVPENLI